MVVTPCLLSGSGHTLVTHPLYLVVLSRQRLTGDLAPGLRIRHAPSLRGIVRQAFTLHGMQGVRGSSPLSSTE